MALAKRILVPTDFSEAGAPALMAAATLAQQLGSSVTLVHVFDPGSLSLGHVGLMPGGEKAPAEAEVEETIARALEATREEYFGGVEGFEAKVLLAASPAEAIVDESERMGADLIVIGTRGRSGIEELLIGSVTERVVRHASCMTLVVPVPPG